MLLLGFVVSVLQGCARVRFKPVPTTSGDTVVRILADGPSKMADLPSGSYQIPGTQVFIYKVPSMGAQYAGLAFGLVGFYAATQEMKEGSKGTINEVEEALRIDIVEETKRAFNEALIQKGSPANWVMNSAKEEADTFDVIPYILMIVEGEAGRPGIFLKARLTRRSDGKTWKNRFGYYLPDRRPIVGPNSWTENKGEALQETVCDALKKTLDILFSVIKEGHTWKGVPGKLKWKEIVSEKVVERKVEILQEKEEVIIFNIPPRAVIDYGINIYSNKEVQKVTP
jgi:hypothetical protein